MYPGKYPREVVASIVRLWTVLDGKNTKPQYLLGFM
jgi:hypothetical protein